MDKLKSLWAAAMLPMMVGAQEFRVVEKKRSDEESERRKEEAQRKRERKAARNKALVMKEDL